MKSNQQHLHRVHHICSGFFDQEVSSEFVIYVVRIIHEEDVRFSHFEVLQVAQAPVQMEKR
jgi:hypothetical protein